jgi:predicted exporter
MKRNKTLKRISFIGMILSMLLMMILLFIFLSMRQTFGGVQTLMIAIAAGITTFFFVCSFRIAIKFKWGDQNGFVPSAF